MYNWMKKVTWAANDGGDASGEVWSDIQAALNLFEDEKMNYISNNIFIQIPACRSQNEKTRLAEFGAGSEKFPEFSLFFHGQRAAIRKFGWMQEDLGSSRICEYHKKL